MFILVSQPLDGPVVHTLIQPLWTGCRLYARHSDGSADKESACNEGDVGLIPGSGRSPGEGNGNALQYSCLGNSMDRGAWWATVHRVAKNRTRLK